MCKRVSAETGCWGPHWFRGDRHSTASPINLFYCSGNVAETFSDPCFVIETVLCTQKIVIHCLFSGHGSILSCKKPLHPLYSHQDSMAISVIQRNTALIQAGFRSFVLHLELHLSVQTKLRCLPLTQASLLPNTGKVLHRQSCDMSKKRREHISIAGTVFMKIPFMWCHESLFVSRTVWLMATL